MEATAVPVRKKGSTKIAEAGDVASPTVTGRVEWRFRMRWGASGEEWKEAEEAGQDVVQPWWSGDRKGKGKAHNGDSGDEWSTRRFRQAREKQLNYKFKEVPVKELCWGVLPIWMEVVGRRGSGGEESERRGEDSEGWGWWGWGLADESFPSGWHCADCGKVNYQVMFRHRKCSSSFCGVCTSLFIRECPGLTWGETGKTTVENVRFGRRTVARSTAEFCHVASLQCLPDFR